MGRLILVRHGESIWNLQNRFTGWVDVSLSPLGVREAETAGALLANVHFDLAFTSTLLRAQDTLYEILKQNRHCQQYVRIHETSREWYEHFTPVPGDAGELKIRVSEKLNERYYGDLQGLNKDRAREQFGAEQVHQWRRDFKIAPPNGESLEMTAARVQPFYRSQVEPLLRERKTVIISAHGNSLRALVMQVEGLSPGQISNFEFPTGTPHVYTFDGALVLQKSQTLK